MTAHGIVITGTYDYGVVALSIAVAVLTSFAALDLAGRVTVATGRTRTAWLIASAAAQGLGIWAMHYTGVLALTLPVPTRYDWPHALVSFLFGVAGAALAVWTVNRPHMSAARIGVSGLVMAAGLVGLHYTAMESMRPVANCQYSPPLVALSAFFALVFALLLLQLTFVLGGHAGGWRMRQIGSALQMGGAISIMHYTGMAAATFTRTSVAPDWSHALPITPSGVLVIGSSTVAVLGVTVFSSVLDHRRRVAAELQRLLEQFRALASRLEHVREEERKRVAREIHDELGQALTGIKFNLLSLVRQAPERSISAEKVAAILRLIDETIQAVRRIATELRPRILDLGVVAAVQWAADEFQTRTGVACYVSVPNTDVTIDGERATALFRIVQETLTNIARHAQATEVRVRLAVEDGSLVLEIRDNGRGIDEPATTSTDSLGILGMRERALLLGGQLTIDGRPGAGTTVRIRLPMSG